MAAPAWGLDVPDAGPGTGLTTSVTASARASGQASTSFALDSQGTPLSLEPVQTRLRITPEMHHSGFGLVAEADLATGAWVGIPSSSVVGARVPYPPGRPVELRKAYLEYTWTGGAVRVGQQVLDWGLGLLSNGARQDPEAGDFGQRQFGPLAYRALVVCRPLVRRDDAWKAFEAALAADLVVRDGSAEIEQGDRAYQAVMALRYASDPEHNFGFYGVLRRQTNLSLHDSSRATQVLVLDTAGRWAFPVGEHDLLRLGVELAGVTGTSSLYPSATASVLAVRQYGGAVKSSYRTGRATLYFDGGYASGDHSPTDDRLEALRFDRDYKVGLVLFDEVLAYQSARTPARIAAASVDGLAPPGAQSLGTGGAVTGAWYLFPRVKVGLADWLDGYGGALFAFSTAPLSDPLETRAAGGVNHNSLGGVPGPYLGTELDLGAQARLRPAKDVALTLTAEGALFLPGSALALPSGAPMGPVVMGRLRCGLAL